MDSNSSVIIAHVWMATTFVTDGSKHAWAFILAIIFIALSIYQLKEEKKQAIAYQKRLQESLDKWKAEIEAIATEEDCK